MREIDTVLLDVDGTILDTREFISQPFIYSLQRHCGLEVTREQVSSVVGKPLAMCYQLLSSLDLVDQMMDTHIQFQRENLHLSFPFPNTKKTLSELKKAGMRLGAVTTRFGDSVGKTLELAGIDGYFDTVVNGSEVTNHKPDAEPVLLALSRLGSEASRTVMVGDTDADVLAGKAALVRKTIGVTYGFGGVKIKDCEPDHVVDDIEEILAIILGRR